MARPKKIEVEESKTEETKTVEVFVTPTELEQLRALYKELKDRGFNSIGDVELAISRLQ